MHMADALLSPAVGGAMWAASAAAIAYATHRLRRDGGDDRIVPLMGVLGAFLFAAQMITFTIPATGSSGHLGGGLLLAILLGPFAAVLTIASVLVVQALFFADGGILALGCNIFNMGVIPAFIVYPLVYRKIAGTSPGQRRRTVAILVSALVGLQLGPLCVVLETWLSGIAALPFTTFLLFMQPIHLAIGVVEGGVTAAVVSFLLKARPDIVLGATEAVPSDRHPLRGVLATFMAIALVTGGVVSWEASRNPDGLEWAIARATATGGQEAPPRGWQGIVARLQQKIAVLPDYSFKRPDGAGPAAGQSTESRTGMPEKAAGGLQSVADARVGTSVAGVVGTIMVLAIVWVGGRILAGRRP